MQKACRVSTGAGPEFKEHADGVEGERRTIGGARDNVKICRSQLGSPAIQGQETPGECHTVLPNHVRLEPPSKSLSLQSLSSLFLGPGGHLVGDTFHTVALGPQARLVLQFPRLGNGDTRSRFCCFLSGLGGLQ